MGLLFCGLGALTAFGHSAHAGPPPALAQQLSKITHGHAFSGSRMSVQVVRMDTGEVLYAEHPHDLLIPASNVKIVTTLAALDTLTPDFQFATELYGALDANGTIIGDLSVKGFGDPYLLPERIWYLASRLRMRGVHGISGNLRIDDSYFDSRDRIANGWQEDRTTRAYMAPAGAVSVGFNALMVHVLPAAVVGAPATVLLDPVQRYAQLTGTVTTGRSGKNGVSVELLPYKQTNMVRVSGSIDATEGPRAYWRRIDNPPLFAGEVLREALQSQGITVAGDVVQDTVSPGAPLLLTFASERLGELIVPLNKYSNNFMASQLALALGAHVYGAPGTWDKAQRALAQFLRQRVDMAVGEYTLGNASGLHSVNALSASQLVRLLRFAAAQPRYAVEFQNSLAVAASSGTLTDRMHDSKAAHTVRAKTGTLAQASSLSGYAISEDGVALAFSCLCNHYSHIEDVWAAQDAFAATLSAAHVAAGKSTRATP